MAGEDPNDPQLVAVDALLRAMLEAGDAALFEWDLGEGTSRGTASHLTMLGYAPDAWPVTYEAWAERVHPDDIGEADAQMQRLLTGQQRLYEAEYRMRTAAGEWRWVTARAYVTGRDAEGPFRVTGFMLDVHRQRARREDQRRLRKVEALGQLTGGIAHDFNNLLAVLRSNLEVLADDPRAEDVEVLDDLTDALQRGEALTRSLVDYARREEARPAWVDARERVQKLARMFETALGGSVELRLTLPGEPLGAHVDPGAFDNALLNLVLNARDALEGRAAPRVEVSAREVALSADEALARGLPPGAYVRVAVRDNGAGMSDEVREQATEPLFTTKGPGRGSGLGLSTVQRFAAQAGGAFDLVSAPDEGAEAILLLPRAASPAAEAARGASEPPGRRPRVLVVDDEPALLRSLTRQLVSRGYDVTAADSPRRALVELEHERFDALLTDLVMPSTLDGAGLAERAKAQHPDLPVLFMTGYAESDARARAAELGPILAKPFPIEELDRALRDALGEG